MDGKTLAICMTIAFVGGMIWDKMPEPYCRVTEYVGPACGMSLGDALLHGTKRDIAIATECANRRLEALL